MTEKEVEKLKNELTKKEKYSFSDLVDLVCVLRSPSGCPWDREQTHKSVRNAFLEEAYEAVEGIDNQDSKLLCEELGDVLFQVLFHARLADEAGDFSINDVINAIVKKMILRHPHVFGDTVCLGSEKVLENWEKIKNKEKERTLPSMRLKAVPRTYPALMRAEKVGIRAAKENFDFKDSSEALLKVYEEIEETKNAKTEKEKLEECGDLLFATVNYIRKMEVDAEEALTKATDKFISRFTSVEEKCIQNNKEMKDCSSNELDAFWQQIKCQKK